MPTYYQRTTASAQGYITATNETAINATTATSATLTHSIPAGTTNANSFSFITDSGNPNLLVWNSGTYQAQLNATTVGGNISFHVLFGRISSDTNTLRTGQPQQGEANFTGTGLKVATTTTIPGAGDGNNAAGDRYAILVRGSNGHAMNAQSLTLTVNTTDSYVILPDLVTASPLSATWI